MKPLLFAFATMLALLYVSPIVYADGYYPAHQVGHDVSWPNCHATPPGDHMFGIVGVTGGLVFRPNPCLFEEAHWFDTLSLYLNTGYAGKARAEKYATYPRKCSSQDEACLAYNFGYNAGVYAITYAASQYVHTNVWWLDVETENSWSGDTSYNQAALTGMVDSLKQLILLPVIGFYSYPGQWDTITGSWQNGYPNWAATGGSSYQLATSYCQAQAFTGGPTWLTQYTTRLDDDYVCS